MANVRDKVTVSTSDGSSDHHGSSDGSTGSASDGSSDGSESSDGSSDGPSDDYLITGTHHWPSLEPVMGPVMPVMPSLGRISDVSVGF